MYVIREIGIIAFLRLTLKESRIPKGLNRLPVNGISFRLLILIVFLFYAVPGNAQSNRRTQRLFEEAKSAYGQKDFDAAVRIGQQVLSSDTAFVNAHLMLADIYRETGNASSEIHHLKKAALHSELPLIRLRLGNAMFLAGDYANALETYTRYKSSGNIGDANWEEVERKIKSCRFALDAMANPVDFRPERLPNTVNTSLDEYWPVLSIDQKQLVITRLIEVSRRLPQEDFYISLFDEDTGWSGANPIEAINTLDNEGAQALSADGNIMFFTACNRRGGFGSCDIYYSIRRNGRWGVAVNAGAIINSTYWDAQPSFSSDGKYLYFASTRPGGKGLRDIWRAENKGFDKNGRLTWGKPVNLGDSINTAGNETSPFIHAGGRDFYFSSDYHTGMGGYDLFVSKLTDDTVFHAPVNLGYPVNTHNDEQGLHIGADGLTAYFSSERDTLSGLDIYSFRVDESIRPHPATYVKALVHDKETRKPLQAEIELANLANHEETAERKTTDSSGELMMCLPVGSNYAFSVSKKGYLFYSNTFDLREIRQVYNPIVIEIGLEPIRHGAEMHLYNIYFQTDSFTILPESLPELNKLVEFLFVNQDLHVEIQGHTDNTGNAVQNQELSEKRARSVVEYLIGRGIDKTKLNWKGYGEDLPVSENDTAEGRRLNRRTTIRILNR